MLIGRRFRIWISKEISLENEVGRAYYHTWEGRILSANDNNGGGGGGDDDDDDDRFDWWTKKKSDNDDDDDDDDDDDLSQNFSSLSTFGP